MTAILQNVKEGGSEVSITAGRCSSISSHQAYHKNNAIDFSSRDDDVRWVIAYLAIVPVWRLSVWMERAYSSKMNL